MKARISTAADLGQWIHQVRRSQRLRQEDLAALSGSSHVTLKKIEHGAEGVAIGRVLAVLGELGIHVDLDLPDKHPASAPRSRKSRKP